MVLISMGRAIFVAVPPHFDRIRDIFVSILFTPPYFIEIRTKLVAIFGGVDGLGGLGVFGGF